MALRKHVAALALATGAALAGTVVAAGPAAAISRVDTATCNSRSDFFTLWNYPPKVCFANNGSVNVAIYDVYQVDTGNNSGSFVWKSTNGSTYRTYYSSWKAIGFSPKVRVDSISITGR
ncbi:beta/gamma crystallin domain-containing protein [Streptomyces sp. NPDC059835]|uniref:beta/gamma crystallin domain-containing protein n=1 Tax=Streptomyces sp. NPDC059835 TaxID=3346967 RepID=UPI00364A8826